MILRPWCLIGAPTLWRLCRVCRKTSLIILWSFGKSLVTKYLLLLVSRWFCRCLDCVQKKKKKGNSYVLGGKNYFPAANSIKNSFYRNVTNVTCWTKIKQSKEHSQIPRSSMIFKNVVVPMQELQDFFP